MNKPLLDDAGHTPTMALPRLHRGREFWADVHIARTEREIGRVQNHRYDVYRQERGADYPGLDHEAQALRDLEDDGALLLYTVVGDGRLTASLRFEIRKISEITESAAANFIWNSRFYTGSDSAIRLSRMCSSSGRHANMHLFRMMLYAYFMALRNGAYFSYLRTLPATKSLYERLGYREFALSEDGFHWMGLELLDQHHLRQVGSPLYSVLGVFGDASGRLPGVV